LNLQAQPG